MLHKWEEFENLPNYALSYHLQNMYSEEKNKFKSMLQTIEAVVCIH